LSEVILPIQSLQRMTLVTAANSFGLTKAAILTFLAGDHFTVLQISSKILKKRTEGGAAGHVMNAMECLTQNSRNQKEKVRVKPLEGIKLRTVVVLGCFEQNFDLTSKRFNFSHKPFSNL
jgi:hypothetical protein